MGLLDGDPAEATHPRWLQDHPRARLQLDVLLTLRASSGPPTTGLLSLVANMDPDPGDTVELEYWLANDFTRFGASWWVRDGFSVELGLPRRHLRCANSSGEQDEQSIRVYESGLRGGLERAQHIARRNDLMAPTEDAPVALFFTAHRDLMKGTAPSERFIARPQEWSHAVVRRFGAEHGVWPASIDHLLAWLDYIDEGRKDGRFVQACRILNKYLFAGTDNGPSKAVTGFDRERLQAIVHRIHARRGNPATSGVQAQARSAKRWGTKPCPDLRAPGGAHVPPHYRANRRS